MAAAESYAERATWLNGFDGVEFMLITVCDTHKEVVLGVEAYGSK